MGTPTANLILNIIAILQTCVLLWFIIEQRKWKLFEFLRYSSAEALEKKLYGFDKSMTPLVITDEDGIITNINEAMCRVFLWSEKEFIGNTLQKIIPDRFWEAHSAGMKRMKGLEMKDNLYSLHARRKTGGEFPIELFLRKTTYNDKFFYLAEIREISHWVAKENKLKQELAIDDKKIKILSKGEELGKTGSWFWDIPTSAVTTSAGYRILFGLVEEKPIAINNIKDRVWSEDMDIFVQTIEASFEGKGVDINLRMIRATDMKILYVQIKTEVMSDDNGSVLCVFGVTRLLETLNLVNADKIPVNG